MERAYRTVVTFEQPAYTTAWGVRREALSETQVYGPYKTRTEANDIEDAARAGARDIAATVTAVVQVTDLDWKDVTE